MPVYLYAVKDQKIRFPLRVVVAIPPGIVKVRFRTLLAPGQIGGSRGGACTFYGNTVEYDVGVNRVMALFWGSDGSLISQTPVIQNDTDVNVPPGAVYVEWRVPPDAVIGSWSAGSGQPMVASETRDRAVMSFIDENNNVTDVVVRLTLICSAWNSPVSVTSTDLPINVDIPFCHQCTGDFSPRQALKGIYAMIRSSRNAKLQAVLLDGGKNVLATCPEQRVGDISSDTEIWLCPDVDPDLVGYLKVYYPSTRYIRVRIDKSNPDGPLPAAIFTIYFSIDKGSLP